MRLRWVVLCCAVLASCGVLFLWTLGPLQWPTVAVYAGSVVVVLGLVGIVSPPRWLGVSRRSDSAWLSAAGALLLMAGLFWPVARHHSAGQSRLDGFLSEYDFEERHELMIHAAPERVMAAVRQVSFSEIGVMRTLGRIRNAAMGRLTGGAPVNPLPIVSLIEKSATGFFPLEHTEREFIFGLAGQPWNNGARPVRLTPQSFGSWTVPGHVKVAANLRVEDAGGGWSRLTTETRVQCTDEAARGTMARYWRLIYPGSGMIRKSLLQAVRVRAEQSH